jgi:hypothetical protein
VNESPPPTIVQLRQKLAALIIAPMTLLDPIAVQVALDECVEMCDWLMSQHPDLVGDYFLKEARRMEEA